MKSKEKESVAKLSPSALSELKSKAQSPDAEGLTIEQMGEFIANSRHKKYPRISKNPLNGNSLY